MKRIILNLVFAGAAWSQTILTGTLTTPGAVPVVQSSGVLAQDTALNWDSRTRAIRIGIGTAAVDVFPKNTEPYGVLSVRSATPDTPTAFDVFPSGAPAQNDKAWMDICRNDLLAPGETTYSCLGAMASGTANSLGSHQSYPPFLPLILGGNPIYFQDHIGQGLPAVFGQIGTMGLRLESGGTEFVWIYSGALRMARTQAVNWANSGDTYGAMDAGLAREAPGVVRITDGNGNYGTASALAYRAAGAAGISRTLTLKGASGNCTLTLTGGIVTGTTCP